MSHQLPTCSSATEAISPDQLTFHTRMKRARDSLVKEIDHAITNAAEQGRQMVWRSGIMPDGREYFQVFLDPRPEYKSSEVYIQDGQMKVKDKIIVERPQAFCPICKHEMGRDMMTGKYSCPFGCEPLRTGNSILT